MPEGPAIVLLKEKLKPFIGQKLIYVEKGTAEVRADVLLDRAVTDIVSHGKQLFICFNDLSLRIHLLLFGSYTINSVKKGSLAVGLYFDDQYLYFYSSHVKLLEQPLADILDFRRNVLSKQWDPELALQDVKKHGKSLICDVLLNQDLFAGIGNKAKDEILFRTFVHPESPTGRIPEDRLKKIIKEALVFSIQHLEALREGSADQLFEVHQRENCPWHKVPLSIKITGKQKRKSYFCKVCQQLFDDQE